MVKANNNFTDFSIEFILKITELINKRKNLLRLYSDSRIFLHF